ncbi:MAG: alpha-amylase family glycosyl hydrolase, partial [Myxococcota bacterium]
MKRLANLIATGLLSSSLLMGCAAGADDIGPAEDSSDVLAEDAPRSAIVQLFNWPFTAIRDEVCNLRDMGFSHVHVSPPQLSNSATAWWGRYQPLDYRQVDGPLGSEGDFQEMTAAAEACGITIIADVVLNHMANLGLNGNDLYYPPNCDRGAPLNSGGNSCLFAPQNFHNEECIFNYDNHCTVMYGRICGGPGDRGLPDLATGFCEPGGFLDIHSRNYDPHVLQMAKNYLIYLQDLGVRAFRFDAAKHMHPAFMYDLLTDPAVTARIDYMYGEIITGRVSSPDLATYRHIPGLDFMDFPLTRALGNMVWSSSSSSTLIAIPFFVLLGEILVRSGVASRTYAALDR